MADDLANYAKPLACGRCGKMLAIIAADERSIRIGRAVFDKPVRPLCSGCGWRTKWVPRQVEGADNGQAGNRAISAERP